MFYNIKTQISLGVAIPYINKLRDVPPIKVVIFICVILHEEKMSPTMRLNRKDENYFSATLVLFEERLKFSPRLLKLQAKSNKLEWQLKNFKHHLMTIICSEENKTCIELISRTSIIPHYMLELICKDREMINKLTRLRLFQNM